MGCKTKNGVVFEKVIADHLAFLGVDGEQRVLDTLRKYKSLSKK